MVVVEVGGTVGDIEGLPFLEAIRQMRNDVGRDNVFYIHVTLLPHMSTTGELKTKPTQHSVKELRSIGIQPDALICRSDYPVSPSIQDKLSLFCDVPNEAIIPLVTVQRVYEVPLILEEYGLGDILVDSLGLRATGRDMTDWAAMVEHMNLLKETLPIALVGKYVELPDSYILGQRGPEACGAIPRPGSGDTVGTLRGYRERGAGESPQVSLWDNRAGRLRFARSSWHG